jgi:hypothetical protein
MARITPADERISMVVNDLGAIEKRLSIVRARLQQQLNPLWHELAELERSVDSTSDLLQNGY